MKISDKAKNKKKKPKSRKDNCFFKNFKRTYENYVYNDIYCKKFNIKPLFSHYFKDL